MRAKVDEKNSLEKRLQEKVQREIREEYNEAAAFLKAKNGFLKEFEYFLEILLLAVSPLKFKEKFPSPCIGFYCIQAPWELFDAFGFHPLRLCSGSAAVQRLSLSSLRVLACPVIKSCFGSFSLNQSLEQLCDVIVVPTTCDWNVKLPEMAKGKASFYIMELPHIKESERGRGRWLEEIYELKRVLQRYSGRRINRRKLLLSINKYREVWRTFGQLAQLRRKRIISGTWSIIIANAFMVDNVESWTEKVNQVIKNCSEAQGKNNPSVFLAGSPVFFPYLKISELIEEAGMFIAADELCTSERNLVSTTVYDESSEYGLLKALAEKYQLSCSCPTFADNDRRLKNILATMRDYNIKGIVYHLLKGCHPYDIESFRFEKVFKENGFHFMKIETDYSKEDRENILCRLEAFRETLC